MISKRSKTIEWSEYFLLFFLLIRSACKIFLTEEKLIQNMQTLSLSLPVNNNNNNNSALNAQDDEYEQFFFWRHLFIFIREGNQSNHSSINEPQIQLHKLLKDNLRQNDFIDKLCDLERYDLTIEFFDFFRIGNFQEKAFYANSPIYACASCSIK